MPDQTRRLPFLAALAVFVLYVCTLGGGLTVNNLALTAQAAGWEHGPVVGQPLLWLVTLPLKILPVAWVSLAGKLIAAALAALIVGLLARTVQLLPWDHPWETSGNLAAALPVITACVVCGLEFAFWQEATSACGELLQLLPLAAGVWLFLEYQARRQPRWLAAAVVVWGIGMAENWQMQAALPLFVIGIIWLERLRFFRWKFVLRLAGLGLAGFSLYALPPLVNGLAPHSPWTFGQSWLASLRETKNTFLTLYYGFWQGHRFLSIGVIVYFLVPTLPLFVRMRDEGMKNKYGVDRFQLWLYRGLRLILLLACLWLAFDPTPGPRQMARRQLDTWLPMLTFDYLTALGAGFLIGNLLLISKLPAAGESSRSRGKIPWKRLAVPATVAGLSLVALGLVARNAPAICRLNFHTLQQFGATALQSLPAGRGIVLCDYPDRLDAFRAALAHSSAANNWLPVDTRELATVEYRARLERRLPAGWLTAQNRHELTTVEALRLLEQVALTNRLFYLNPAYGPFFERFYLEPVGTIFEMKLRGKDPLDVPPVSAAATAANEQFWNRLWDTRLASLVPPSGRPGYWTKTLAGWGLAAAPRFQDGALAEWYSVPLESWAVTLQKQGRLSEAQVRFKQALRLNTNNLSARISLACNTNLIAGTRLGMAYVGQLVSQLGNRDRVSLLVNNGGLVDEPTVDYLLGTVYMDHGLLVQAAEQLDRARTLAPGTLAPQLALAEIYNRLRMTGRSRRLIDQLREESRRLPDNSTLDLNLALMDSYWWLLHTNVSNARNLLQSVVKEHPDDPEITGRVLAAYVAYGDVTNALRLVNAQLAKNPDDLPDLNNKAIILMHAGRAAEAIPVLDHVLSLTNLLGARLNRAFARLVVGDFTQAESELLQLQKDHAASGMIDYGLASVAEHRQDTNSATRYLQLCLTNTAAGTPLWQQASARLRLLEPAAGGRPN